MIEARATMATTHTSLRVEDTIMASVDASRAERPGAVSRNTWITEAIVERLQREGRLPKEKSGA
jgi:hypothetical protein